MPRAPACKSELKPQEFELKVVSVGRDDHVLAVGVIGCTSCNRNPHITELRLKFGDLKLSGFNPALLCFQIFEPRCQEEAVSGSVSYGMGPAL